MILIFFKRRNQWRSGPKDTFRAITMLIHTPVVNRITRFAHHWKKKIMFLPVILIKFNLSGIWYIFTWAVT
jgi:hypothetical protein